MIHRLKDFLKYFRNLQLRGIRGRMIAMGSAPLVLMVALTGYLFYAVNTLSQNLNGVIDNTVPALTTSKELNSEINAASKFLWGAYIFRQQPEQFEQNVYAFERSLDRMQSARERYLEIKMTEKAGLLRKQADAILSEISPVTDRLKTLLAEKKADKIPEIANAELLQRFSNLEEALSNIEMNNSDLIEAERENAAKLTKRTRYSIIFGSLLSIVVSFLISLVYSSKISESLGMICGQLSEESDKTKMQSTDISAASQQLAQSSTESASALQETAAAVEEMSAMIQKNAANAVESARISTESAEQVGDGKTAINEIKARVSEIKEGSGEMVGVVDANNERIAEILQVINEIGAKTQIINDIVFQTKLLSFNASVEAARAGEHGKGFAVVAEEVGNLAKSSGSAAQEISKLLADSTSRVQQIIEQTKESMSSVTGKIQTKIAASDRAVDASIELLEKIAEKSSQVVKLVDEISTASVEQSNGVTEIGKSMQQLDIVSNQNMAEGQKIALASSMLLDQAGSLETIVNKLTTLVEGKS